MIPLPVRPPHPQNPTKIITPPLDREKVFVYSVPEKNY